MDLIVTNIVGFDSSDEMLNAILTEAEWKSSY